MKRSCERNRPMTIEEISKLANVSKATVSRVLNRNGYVSEEKKKKVLEVLKETGYQHPEGPRKPAIGKIHTVGVIISEMTNPYFLSSFEGIAAAADQYGPCEVINLTEQVFVDCSQSGELSRLQPIKNTRVVQLQSFFLAEPFFLTGQFCRIRDA